MSDVVGKKFYNAEQPQGSTFKILNGGPSIAVSGFVTGNDNLGESEGQVVGNGGATTPKGFIVQGHKNPLALAETVTVTVV